jgi:hypothetical protein
MASWALFDAGYGHVADDSTVICYYQQEATSLAPVAVTMASGWIYELEKKKSRHI